MVATVQTSTVRDHLIAILERRGLLTAEQAAVLRTSEHGSQEDLEQELVQTYGVPPETILLVMAEHAQIPVTRLRNLEIREDLLDLCPPEMLSRGRAIPIARTRST